MPLQPLPHFWPNASQPFHVSLHRLHDERILGAKVGLKVGADFFCRPGRGNEPDERHSLDAVLKDFEGAFEGLVGEVEGYGRKVFMHR